MSDLAAFLLERIAEDEARVDGFHQGADPDFYWGPARVLAECAAKRRIVQMYVDERRPYVLEDVLFFLAQPYADHPDYRDEWRP